MFLKSGPFRDACIEPQGVSSGRLLSGDGQNIGQPLFAVNRYAFIFLIEGVFAFKNGENIFSGAIKSPD
ncbi:hypothetical protein [Pseudomonas sp. FH1]|uniref:hypothetical protein n=1 Tax=Pseudomonas sp. FH1 TaxID=1284392 RepID=UPI0012EA3118|nr:hypothetical protein [Pseudomonas sp. FH1]